MTKSTPKSFRSISTTPVFVGPLGVYRLITSTIGPKALPQLTPAGIDQRWDAIAATHARRRSN